MAPGVIVKPGASTVTRRFSAAKPAAEVGRLLFARGVYVTLAAYPLVPKTEVGFRVQLTAANTDAEVGALIGAVTELAERGELQSSSAKRALEAA